MQAGFLGVGKRLAVDFANTVYAPGDPEGAVRSWADVVAFLREAGAVESGEADRLRRMGRKNPRQCAAALARALELRRLVRAVLGAVAARERLRIAWLEAVNRALRSGAGAEALARAGSGWRLAFLADRRDPLAALAPIARSLAEIIAEGPGAPVRRCANPRCVLYFYDDSRTGRRRWCSMAVCGNRMKVAAHARRRARGGRG